MRPATGDAAILIDLVLDQMADLLLDQQYRHPMENSELWEPMVIVLQALLHADERPAHEALRAAVEAAADGDELRPVTWKAS